MEALLGIVLIIGVLVVAVGKRQKYVPRPRPRQARPVSPPKKRRPPPFEAKTATPAATRKTLRGAAFVVDGDTLVIQKTQIRLFGVDAPEINHPYGKKAKWALVSLCKGQAVRAEIHATDDHGRTVAQCFLPDGRDLSAEMVKIGLAIDWPKFSDGKYRSLEVPEARKKMWLADARQKGRMHVWAAFEAKQKTREAKK